MSGHRKLSSAASQRRVMANTSKWNVRQVNTLSRVTSQTKIPTTSNINLPFRVRECFIPQSGIEIRAMHGPVCEVHDKDHWQSKALFEVHGNDHRPNYITTIIYFLVEVPLYFGSILSLLVPKDNVLCTTVKYPRERILHFSNSSVVECYCRELTATTL